VSAEPSGGALLDDRGCLTPRGLAALVRAPVGQAPPELATHLAGCARCQERLLATGRESDPVPKPAPKAYRNVALVIMALLAGLIALGMTLSILHSRG
jgi:hypothetical protein